MAKSITVTLFIFLLATWSTVRGQEDDPSSSQDDAASDLRLSDNDVATYNGADERSNGRQTNSISDYARRAQLFKLLSHMSRNQREMYELARALTLQNRSKTPIENYMQQRQNVRLSPQYSGYSRSTPMLRLDLARSTNEQGSSDFPALNGIGREDSTMANESVDMKPLSARMKRRRCRDATIGVKNPSLCDADGFFRASDQSSQDAWNQVG